MRYRKKYTPALFLLFALPLIAQVPPKPRLVLFIAADQFRADYLQRFRSDYKEGFDQLLTRGAVFADARFEHFPTVTAIGHSTFLTGATPSMSGIVGNEWYDRASGKSVTSVSDDSVKLLGGPEGNGSSPQRLLVSTVGDELKIANQGRSRVIGISLKDRGAILPAGHMADGAFWFDGRTGNFVSSTYYFSDLPEWVKEFNASRAVDRYRGAEWMGKELPMDAGGKLYQALPASPFGNELIEELAERAIRVEQLGRHDTPDLLTLSFSSNDLVGHTYGPDSPEVRDISIRTDRLLGKLFKFVNSQVGMQAVLVVFTADHGVTSVPDINLARKMPGGRVSLAAIRDAVQRALVLKYGDGRWIAGSAEFSIYLNRNLIEEKDLDEAEVEQAAAQAALELPHVFRVYTRSQLMNGAATDPVARRVLNGFNFRRSGDVCVLLEPYWIPAAAGTTHGSPFTYDTHVPLIFMGQGVRAGKHFGTVAVNDIAPTLAAILGIEIPSGSVGRILSEIFLTTEAPVARKNRGQSRSLSNVLPHD